MKPKSSFDEVSCVKKFPKSEELSPSSKATLNNNIAPSFEKKRAPAVFKPTKDITQKMMDDWIAGCLKMLKQSKFKNIESKSCIIESTEEKEEHEIIF